MRRPILVWPSGDDDNPRAIVAHEQLQRARRQKVARRRRRVANIVLCYSFAFLTIYTVAALWLFRDVGVELTTTTTCVFAVIGTEMAGMLVKRICDKHNEAKTKEEEPEHVEG